MNDWIPSLAALSVSLLASALAAAPYADAVIDYTPGTTAVAGYQTPDRALGEPSRVTPFGPVDSAVTPFNPPWPSSQLVSVGAGGSLTLHLGERVRDDASHLYGVDFSIFGNNGFRVVDYSVPESSWTTDGELFNFDPPGSSKVWVSENNKDYFQLVPPPGTMVAVDGLFPTDGQGSFQQPTDPRLGPSALSGRTLAGIRSAYNGSAGGAGFDLGWAQALDGTPVKLDDGIEYVRIDVLQGKVEIDGVAVVPEPAWLALFAIGGLALRSLRKRA
ncbi:MAG: hypothetical protein HYR88_14680 [Verrucomicrobia bacterium]|nr:hypothetical protein [Verrucomicrobiota bacterium]MBI3867772.1 hypothetical protein [Verrucomicrobiota bacterium]